jgi:hypothetical protein
MDRQPVRASAFFVERQAFMCAAAKKVRLLLMLLKQD